MHRTKKQKNRPRSWLRRTVAVAAMVSIVALLLSQSVFAQNSYVITDGDNVTVHQSFSTDPDVVLDEAGIELSEEDTYTTTYNEDGVGNIDIQRMQMITVTYHGSRSVIGTYGETIESLLTRMDITLGKNDVLSCKREALTYDGMDVEIIERVVEITENDVIVPHETKYFEDPELAPDAELVLVEGEDGAIHYTTQVIYENGKEVSREVIDEVVLAEPTTKLVICGIDRAITEQPDEPDHLVQNNENSTSSESATVPSESGDQPLAGGSGTVGNGVITTSTGTTYTYTDVLTVSATAYSCEGYTGYTYSGTVARVGAIAVDPKVIPLGTKMYIVSNDGQYVYGYCVAEDIGGGIKGNRVDLYFDTFDECWQFGVRTCTVYILG